MSSSGLPSVNRELKIQGPGTFKGSPKEDINIWLQRVFLFFTWYNLTDTEKAQWIAMNLEGPAFVWFQAEDSA
jgi:hypothetical protein